MHKYSRVASSQARKNVDNSFLSHIHTHAALFSALVSISFARKHQRIRFQFVVHYTFVELFGCCTAFGVADWAKPGPATNWWDGVAPMALCLLCVGIFISDMTRKHELISSRHVKMLNKSYIDFIDEQPPTMVHTQNSRTHSICLPYSIHFISVHLSCTGFASHAIRRTYVCFSPYCWSHRFGFCFVGWLNPRKFRRQKRKTMAHSRSILL